MKGLKYFFVLGISFALFSCEKDEISKVHFHGLITYDCAPQQPAKNISITIYAVSDDARGNQYLVGTVTTDTNGYYSLSANVTYNQALYYYHFVAGANGMSYQTTGNDIEMNGKAESGPESLVFHIKNAFPFDSNDVLDTLEMTSDTTQGSLRYFIVAANLPGPLIDTTITLPIADHPYYYLRYVYTKNNVAAARHEITFPVCYGTNDVVVLY